MVGTYAQGLYSLEGFSIPHSGPWQASGFEVGRAEVFGVGFVISGASIHGKSIEISGTAVPWPNG
jgi:hypothetical protein